MAVIAMIQRKGGATLDEIMKATGWQKHTAVGVGRQLKVSGLPSVPTIRFDDSPVVGQWTAEEVLRTLADQGDAPMKRDWSADELAGHWTLLPSEQDLLTGQNTAPTINVAALVSII